MAKKQQTTWKRGLGYAANSRLNREASNCTASTIASDCETLVTNANTHAFLPVGSRWNVRSRRPCLLSLRTPTTSVDARLMLPVDMVVSAREKASAPEQRQGKHVATRRNGKHVQQFQTSAVNTTVTGQCATTVWGQKTTMCSPQMSFSQRHLKLTENCCLRCFLTYCK